MFEAAEVFGASHVIVIKNNPEPQHQVYLISHYRALDLSTIQPSPRWWLLSPQTLENLVWKKSKDTVDAELRESSDYVVYDNAVCTSHSYPARIAQRPLSQSFCAVGFLQWKSYSYISSRDGDVARSGEFYKTQSNMRSGMRHEQNKSQKGLRTWCDSLGLVTLLWDLRGWWRLVVLGCRVAVRLLTLSLLLSLMLVTGTAGWVNAMRSLLCPQKGWDCQRVNFIQSVVVCQSLVQWNTGTFFKTNKYNPKIFSQSAVVTS